MSPRLSPRHIYQALSAKLASWQRGLILFLQSLRVKRYFLRQRIVLTIRLWFHLPSDDVKDQRINVAINGLIDMDQKVQETLQTLVRVNDGLLARLQWYESHIPRMRDLRREFDREQARLAMQSGGDSTDLANGILSAKPPHLALSS